MTIDVTINFPPSVRSGHFLLESNLGDEMLPTYAGFVINQYKDPYGTTSKMESKRVSPKLRMVSWHRNTKSGSEVMGNPLLII